MAGETPEQKIPPRAKAFSCTNCGAEVNINYSGLAMSVSCPACKSLIDVTDSNYRILQEYNSMMLREPPIPLGRRATLFGRTWELIGFIWREDNGYTWDEYLLFNPYYGYRWLVQNEGHWNFTTMIKERPLEKDMSVLLGEETYKKYNAGVATVKFVLGEFYWRVNTLWKVTMIDYIAPPYMLSKEETEGEVTWSRSEYISHKEVAQAFKVLLEKPRGVGPNQPFSSQRDWRQMKILWFLFSVLLTIFAYGCGVCSTNSTVFQQAVGFQHNSKVQNTTLPTFSVRGKHGTLKVVLAASSLDNSWLWMAGEIVNDDDGTTIPFERNIEYYHGYDSDGSWSEGGTQQDFIVQNVPGGNYYINIDTESGDFKDTNTDSFQIQVVRDPVQYANYFWCLMFLSVLPSICWYNNRSLEVNRWTYSDFSPYGTSYAFSGSNSDTSY